MPWSPRRGQGADAATVSVRATSAADGTRVLAGALGDAESVGDAEAVGDAELDGAGVGEADGVGVAELDGAGVGDGDAAGGGCVEPDFGRERAMGPSGRSPLPTERWGRRTPGASYGRGASTSP